MAIKQRSPAYPGLPLEVALERAQAFYKAEGRHQALVSTAATHWKYSAKSSGATTTIAALKAYGLMDDKGSGSERKVFLTPAGLRILMDERSISHERDEAIQEAALAPRIMSEMWKKFGTDLPSTDTIYHFLRMEKGYSDVAVKDVLEIYRKNVTFAKLDKRYDDQGDMQESMMIAAPAPPSPDEMVTAIPMPGSPYRSNVPSLTRPGLHNPQPSPPPAPAFAAGEEIGNYRVSKSTTIRLIAFGPYNRQSIEGLVKQLNLALELGNFDDLAEVPEEE